MRYTIEDMAGNVSWATVKGPASAALMSARRLGWQFVSATEIDIGGNSRLLLGRDSPAFVREKVTEALSLWRARNVEAKLPCLQAEGLEVGPHMGPILRLLDFRRAAGEWTHKLQGDLRSVVSNRQWTQQRLHQAGLVDDPVCRLCIATLRCGPASEDPAFKGTLMHRYCTCPAMASFREQHMPEAEKLALRSKLNRGNLSSSDMLWFTRGLRRSPFLAEKKLRSAEHTFEWIVRPEDGLLVGSVYTDGSLLDNQTWLEGNCSALGWAFVILTEQGVVIASAKGVPPGWVDSIYGAEAWAVLMVVQHAMPGAVRIVSDCQSVQQDCGRGMKWASAPNRKFARIWVSISNATDHGDNPISIIWMPARTAEGDVTVLTKSDGSTLTLNDRSANGMADLLAKAGAASQRCSRAFREAIHREASEVSQMAIWLAKATQYSNHFPLDGGHIRDSDAVARKQKGVKRKCGVAQSAGEPEEYLGRLFKAPKLEALRARVLARVEPYRQRPP